MAELLFLVSRNHADLASHLSHEFSGGDVHVLIDRRRAERRCRDEAESHPNRRTRERRARRTTEHELRSIGYSIVSLEAAARIEAAPGANPIAVREVAGYLREAFRFLTLIPSWDHRREGQGFVLLNAVGRPAHRLLFTKEFLDYYGEQGVERIPRLLDEWKLPQRVELAGSDLILVSSYGIRAGDW
ncbi:MAG TPA: hypothetical protein VJU81_14785 [Methylomirabilota bacterium]|nr:hypothetical protein [Methylomirabilota bacterium]